MNSNNTGWQWPLAGLMILLLTGCLADDSDEGTPLPGGETGEDIAFNVETLIEGLVHPWSLAFLENESGDQALVTERPGRLRLIDLETGTMQEITGLPDIAAIGQGGLLDVILHPDYGSGREWVYLSYVAEDDGNGRYATHVGRGRLDIDNLALLDFEVLHVATPFSGGGQHFGSRLAFDSQWRLYVTVGDRGDRHSAQDLESHWGKTLRLDDDGSIPADNPFVGDADALDAIYTYGHRNAQGMTVHPQTGVIWLNEHGQMNGDEINIIDQPGGNYGWPIATHSREYGSGEPIGDLPEEREDTVNPVYYWDGTRYDDGQAGFPPSGMAFHFGDAFSAWNGELFMGNLAHQYLARFEVQGREVIREHRLLRGQGWRIRDVRIHPGSGHIVVLVDAENGRVARLIPEDATD